jgi:excisionase family DNA binding protein
MSTTPHTQRPSYGDQRAKLDTVDVLAAWLDVSRWQVYRLVREDRIPSIRVGQRLRFDREAVREALERSATGTEHAP